MHAKLGVLLKGQWANIHAFYRGSTLHNILGMLEDNVNVTTDNIDIAILPPTNVRDDLTGEDSGDDEVSVNNLPGSQLRPKAVLKEDEV